MFLGSKSGPVAVIRRSLPTPHPPSSDRPHPHISRTSTRPRSTSYRAGSDGPVRAIFRFGPILTPQMVRIALADHSSLFG